MKFLIRDDDPCAFTRPEELRRCYDGIWEHIPVNFSVTPFRVPGSYRSTPKELYGSMTPMPLASNPELIALLKQGMSRNQIDVALHGYYHEMPGGIPEYIAGERLLEKTTEAKSYLENLLGQPVTTFVPPNNGIGRRGLGALIANGLNLVSNRGKSLWRFRRADLMAIPPLAYYRWVRSAQYPFVLDLVDHKEVGYTSLTPGQTLSELIDAFKLCSAADGCFVLAVHYHAFDRRIKSGELLGDAVKCLLDVAAKQSNVTYLSYRDLWSDHTQTGRRTN